VYEKIGQNIGATKNGEVDYTRVSKKIINDLRMELIKNITFDQNI
jgi:ribosome biogenesis GTPase A